MGYKTAILDFKIWKVLEILGFFNIFLFFAKKCPKFPNFQKKNGLYVLE